MLMRIVFMIKYRESKFAFTISRRQNSATFATLDDVVLRSN